MEGGSASNAYQSIESHFSGKLADFEDETMQRITGPASLLQELNRTFGFDCGILL